MPPQRWSRAANTGDRITFLRDALAISRLGIVLMQGLVITLVLTSLTILMIIVALTRAFGDAGKAAALILLILQLSSAGGSCR